MQAAKHFSNVSVIFPISGIHARDGGQSWTIRVKISESLSFAFLIVLIQIDVLALCTERVFTSVTSINAICIAWTGIHAVGFFATTICDTNTIIVTFRDTIDEIPNTLFVAKLTKNDINTVFVESGVSISGSGKSSREQNR